MESLILHVVMSVCMMYRLTLGRMVSQISTADREIREGWMERPAAFLLPSLSACEREGVRVVFDKRCCVLLSVQFKSCDYCVLDTSLMYVVT